MFFPAVAAYKKIFNEEFTPSLESGQIAYFMRVNLCVFLSSPVQILIALFCKVSSFDKSVAELFA